MKMCIVCEKPVEGKMAVRVKEDNIIRAIRLVKRTFKVARENELYVCEDDLKKHLERRASFNKTLIFFGIVAVALVVLSFISMLLSENIKIEGLIFSIIVGAFLVLFALLFKYTPEVESAPPSLVPLSEETKEEERTSKVPSSRQPKTHSKR
ncbi:MAG: hypothetical protein QW590_03520 [Candidatus Bilamarchaeaceae archaeon]